MDKPVVLKPSQVERACNICGKLYIARKCHLAKGVGKTCSYQCGRALGREALRKAQQSDEGYFWSRVDTSGGPDACWPFIGTKNACGYGTLSYQSRVYRAHRLALILSDSDKPDLQALHHCDNPPCCNPKHLYWGTRSDNMKDAWKRGRQPATRAPHRRDPETCRAGGIAAREKRRALRHYNLLLPAGEKGQ